MPERVTIDFFTTRRYVSEVSCVRLSQAGTVPKRLNVGSRKQRCIR